MRFFFSMENLVPLSGKEQEKSNFSQPYILLSQLYSKKRGSFEDIKLGINGKLEPKGIINSLLFSFYFSESF